MNRVRLLYLVAGAAVLLGGCVEVPSSPTVAVMPAPYKPFDVFQADDQTCRGFARQQVSSDTSGYAAYSLQYRFNVAYEQCMYAKGNQIPGYAPRRIEPAPPAS